MNLTKTKGEKQLLLDGWYFRQLSYQAKSLDN